VSPDGVRWFLINASPDVRQQLARLAGQGPAGNGVRHVPIEAVVLTDAELDHSLGIVLLREARTLAVYATDATTRILEHDSRVLATTRAFATVSVSPLVADEPVPLRDRTGAPSGLTAEAFVVAGDAPRFATEESLGHTVGLMIRDTATGGALAYVPGCGEIDEALANRLRAADAVLFDGTFWQDDELRALGISAISAREMGHVPISGSGGSLAMLATLPARVRVYTHINNSNPILAEDSAARAAVNAAGVVVGDDGMTFTA
jgi:pyrroloquinoline quinone biosynthesis protein B